VILVFEPRKNCFSRLGEGIKPGGAKLSEGAGRKRGLSADGKPTSEPAGNRQEADRTQIDKKRQICGIFFVLQLK
jgi:hypothetical protein